MLNPPSVQWNSRRNRRNSSRKRISRGSTLAERSTDGGHLVTEAQAASDAVGREPSVPQSLLWRLTGDMRELTLKSGLTGHQDNYACFLSHYKVAPACSRFHLSCDRFVRIRHPLRAVDRLRQVRMRATCTTCCNGCCTQKSTSTRSTWSISARSSSAGYTGPTASSSSALPTCSHARGCVQPASPRSPTPTQRTSHTSDEPPHACPRHDSQCLLEIWEAHRFQIPTILLTVVGCGARQLDPADAYYLLSDLEVELERRNPGALRELKGHLPKDVSIRQFSETLIDWLKLGDGPLSPVSHVTIKRKGGLKFHPHGTDNTVLADVSDLVNESACLLPLDPSLCHMPRHP